MSEKSVFSFHDPAAFLMSTYDARKKARPSFSLAAFSKLLGFSSKNYAGLVMRGQRSLTSENVHKVAKALSLTFEETEYFATLVSLKQSEHPEELAFLRQKIKILKKNRPSSSARISSEKLFTEWHHPVVLLAVERAPKEKAIERVRAILPLPAAQIEQMLNRFLATELLIERDGTYALNHAHQIFHDVRSTSARHHAFLSSQLELSRRVLRSSYGDGPKFYSHTFTIARQDRGAYEDRLRTLLADFTARSEESTPEEVAQLNIQFFTIHPRLAPLGEKNHE